MKQTQPHARRPRRYDLRMIQVVLGYFIIFGVLFWPVVYGIMSIPEDFRLPQDASFLVWSLPFFGLCAVAIGVVRFSGYGTKLRSLATHFSIVMGLLGFFMMADTYVSNAFTEARAFRETAEAQVTSENSFKCTRKADGGMECLNALGEPDSNYSYTVIEQSDP